jgi:hypothetical protein
VDHSDSVGGKKETRLSLRDLSRMLSSCDINQGASAAQLTDPTDPLNHAILTNKYSIQEAKNPANTGTSALVRTGFMF